MFKKLKTLALLPVMCLVACSGPDSYYGKYAFRLGKAGSAETRIGVEVTLSDKNVETVAGAKELIFKLETGSELSILELLKLFLEVDEDGNVHGYYIIKETSNADGKLVKIGLNTKISEEILPHEILEKILQHIVTAHVDKKTLTIQIPVSLDDIKMQLAWYGYYIGHIVSPDTGVLTSSLVDLRQTTTEGDLPGDYGKNDPAQIEKRYGTHPIITYDEQGATKRNDVDDYNHKFKESFSNTYLVTQDASSGKYISAAVTYDYSKDKSECDTFIVEDGVEIASEGTEFTLIREGYKAMTVNIKIDPTRRKITYLKDGDKEYYGKDISYYVAEPYVFRDYHALKIGLLKE